MSFDATVDQFMRIPHLHPTLAEIWTYPAEICAAQLGMKIPGDEQVEFGDERPPVAEAVAAAAAIVQMKPDKESTRPISAPRRSVSPSSRQTRRAWSFYRRRR